jgi:hypothetical protein
MIGALHHLRPRVSMCITRLHWSHFADCVIRTEISHAGFHMGPPATARGIARAGVLSLLVDAFEWRRPAG